MTKDEALMIVIDLASRYIENAEESLPQRISPEMLVNDELWSQVASELTDDYEREEANTLRSALQAINVLTAK